MVRWLSDRDIAADVPHAEGASDGAVNEKCPTAELVNEDKEPEECDDCLDDTEDTCGKQGGVCACDADRFENGRSIVVDRVDARRILPQEERTTEEEAVSRLAVIDDGSEGLPEAQADRGSLRFDCVVDGVDLFLHVNVIRREPTEPAKVLDPLLAATFGEEPSR